MHKIKSWDLIRQERMQCLMGVLIFEIYLGLFLNVRKTKNLLDNTMFNGGDFESNLNFGKKLYGDIGVY